MSPARFLAVLFVTFSFCLAPAVATGTSCGEGAGTVPGDLVWEGAEAAARLGASVSSAGDIDGDGRAELIAGAPYALQNSLTCGKAYILAAPQGASGALPVPGANVLVTIWSTKKNSLLGASVAGLGDFDGDGFLDVAIGLPGAAGYVNGDNDDNVAYTGAVVIVYGSASMPATIDIDTYPVTRLVGATAGEQAGYAVAAAGDVNGDGLADVIIGAPRAKEKATGLKEQKGRAYVVFGNRTRRDVIDLETQADVTIEGVQSYAKLGSAVAGIGDMNGDGFADVAIGSPYLDTYGYSDTGEALVVFGSTAMPAVIDPSMALIDIGLRLSGRGSGIRLGWAVGGADVNGDGFPDLVAGAPYGGDLQAGVAYVFFGAAVLPSENDVRDIGSRGVVIAGTSSYGYLGLALAGVGDVNADGIDDMAIAAPNAPDGVLAGAGIVYVLNGRATWPQSTNVTALASRTIAGGRAYAGFGEALAAAGDHAGSAGFDFAVGVPRQSPNGLACAGQISVFCGEVIPGPSSLTCTVRLLDVELAWTNNGAYDEIRITRDGQALVTLPGTESSYVDVAAPTGSHTYTVAGLAFGRTTNAAECQTQVQVVPVRDAACTADARTVTLTWSLGMAYDLVRVTRGGVPVAELPGTTTTWADPDAPYGAQSYAVIGIVGLQESVPAPCEVYVPRPPSELRCSADGTSVALAWTEPDPYDTVTILKDGVLLTVLPGGVGSYLDTNVAAGVHTYALRATLGASASETVACQTTVVPAPVNATCAANADSASVAWDLGAAYDAVIVFLDGENVATLPGDAQAYTVSGLAPGTHVIEIAGEIAGVQSARTACTLTVLAAPSAFACVAQGSAVILTWQNAGAYVELVIVRDGVELARLPGGSGTYTDANAPTGSHTYEIYGTAERATSARATCTVSRLDNPGGVTCTALGNDVTIRWTNVSAYDEIVISRDGTPLATLPGTTTEYVDAGVAQGSHTYTVRGRAGSSQTDAVACEVVSPGAPSALVCTAQGASVTLTWTNGDAYGAVIITRNGVDLVALPGTAQQYVDNTAVAGQTYDYVIVGTIGASLSDPASCRITLPPPVSALACSAIEDRVSLSWLPAGENSAVIVWRDDVQIAQLPAGATSFEESVATPASYEYAVCTQLGSAVGAPVVCEVETVVAPTALSCVAVGGDVTLNWALEVSYDTITVMRNDTEIAHLPGTALTYRDEDLAPGQYAYTILVASGTGSASAHCNVRAPAPPSHLNCFVADGTITLSWENPEVYDQIVINRNGVELAVLAGNAATYTDSDAQAGVVYTYELVGQTGLHRTPSVTCTLKIPGGVTGLVCAAAGDRVTLTWTAGDAYDEVRIARNGQTIASGLPGTTITYEDLGLAPGAYSYQVTGLIAGARGPAATCAVAIIPVPTALACQIMPEAGTVRITWTNPTTYESLTLSLNGAPIAQLPGTATEYVDEVPGPGAWTYALVGHGSNSESVPATCVVNVLPSVENVDCVADGANVTVVWTLGGEYTQIKILRDGVLIATVPGTDTSYTDAGVASGAHVYRLTGYGEGGSASLASAPCATEVVMPPADLLCAVDTSGSTARIDLSWSLAGTYDSIVIERAGPDGLHLLGQVSGTETTYTDATVGEGAYTYRVIANIGLSTAPSAPCEAVIERSRFVRGDSNHDRDVDIADVIFTLSALFRDGEWFACADAADANDDGGIDVSDAIYLINFEFKDGPPPPPPFPQPGLDPTPDPHTIGGDLGCETGY